MSVKTDMINVTPPAICEIGRMTEKITSNDHSCGYCHGNGFIWGEEIQERVEKDCPVCQGSGKLDAAITIEWKPSKPNSHEKNYR